MFWPPLRPRNEIYPPSLQLGWKNFGILTTRMKLCCIDEITDKMKVCSHYHFCLSITVIKDCLTSISEYYIVTDFTYHSMRSLWPNFLQFNS